MARLLVVFAVAAVVAVLAAAGSITQEDLNPDGPDQQNGGATDPQPKSPGSSPVAPDPQKDKATDPKPNTCALPTVLQMDIRVVGAVFMLLVVACLLRGANPCAEYLNVFACDLIILVGMERHPYGTIAVVTAALLILSLAGAVMSWQTCGLAPSVDIDNTSPTGVDMNNNGLITVPASNVYQNLNADFETVTASNVYQDFNTKHFLLVFIAQSILIFFVGQSLWQHPPKTSCRSYATWLLATLVQIAGWHTQLGKSFDDEVTFWYRVVHAPATTPERNNVELRLLMSFVVNGTFRTLLMFALPLTLMRIVVHFDFVKDAVSILFIASLDDLNAEVAIELYDRRVVNDRRVGHEAHHEGGETQTDAPACCPLFNH
mmetsp:Transcript_133658/g.427357  ORF Transcript_133658/g.427357 Transcript_133658/m.427357 type:complete len:375 (-) Transcript_133658:120-1244(-)